MRKCILLQQDHQMPIKSRVYIVPHMIILILRHRCVHVRTRVRSCVRHMEIRPIFVPRHWSEKQPRGCRSNDGIERGWRCSARAKILRQCSPAKRREKGGRRREKEGEKKNVEWTPTRREDFVNNQEGGLGRLPRNPSSLYPHEKIDPRALARDAG